MSQIVIKQCDCCGVQKQYDRLPAGEQPDPWWDFQYTTMDTPTEDGRAWKFRSGSWDLCPDCSTKARDAIIAAVGEPEYDDWDDA